MKSKQIILLSGMFTLMLIATAPHAAAQVQTTGAAGTPLVLPRPDSHFSGNVGRTYLDSGKPQFPQPVQPPKGAPNIVLILIDDAGFGQFSNFGGGVPSPTMEKLAAEGLRRASIRRTRSARPAPTGSDRMASGVGRRTPVSGDGGARRHPLVHGRRPPRHNSFASFAIGALLDGRSRWRPARFRTTAAPRQPR